MVINIPIKYKSPVNKGKINKPDPLSKFFDIDEIGTGKRFTAGSQKGRLYGLWGVLRKYQKSGRTTYTANLSMDNLTKIHGLISEQLEKSVTGLTRAGKRQIMQEADKMAKSGGGWSFEDKKDLGRILNALSVKKDMRTRRISNPPQFKAKKVVGPTVLKAPLARTEEIVEQEKQRLKEEKEADKKVTGFIEEDNQEEIEPESNQSVSPIKETKPSEPVDLFID